MGAIVGFGWVSPLIVGFVLGWYGIKARSQQEFYDKELGAFSEKCNQLCSLGADYWQQEILDNAERLALNADYTEIRIIALQHDLNTRLSSIADSRKLHQFEKVLSKELDELLDVMTGGKFQVSTRAKDMSRVSKILRTNTNVQRLIFEQRAKLNSILPSLAGM